MIKKNKMIMPDQIIVFDDWGAVLAATAYLPLLAFLFLTVVIIALIICNKIIATNQDCLSTMAVKSEMLNFATKIYSPVKEDVSISAKKIVRRIPKNKNS